jgi:cytochrome P450 family 110
MSALPPGPRLHPIRQALKFGADPYGFLEECRRELGDVFTLSLPGDAPRVVLCDPAHVKQVFAMSPDDERSEGQGFHINIGPRSVLFSSGEHHKRQRTLLAPPLHGARLRSYATAMHDVTMEHIAGWKVGETFALHPTMQAITLDVILRCVFGVDPHEPTGARMRDATAGWIDAVFAPQWSIVSMAVTGTRLRRFFDRVTRTSRARARPRRLPVPWAAIADRMADLLAVLSADIAACRRNGTGGREDVLALLVDARDENGERMDDEEILDQLVTMLTGGHETTATTLCWTMHHLLQNPTTLERLRGELREAFGDGPVDPARCGELKWLDACIVESMRIAPIAVAVVRQLARAYTVGGHELPAGVAVWPCTFLVQRRPDLYPSPTVFEPERFFDGSTPRPERYFPYGGGRRRCLGAAFAQFEMRIVLAAIVHHGRLRAAPGDPPRGVFRGITVAPSGGVPVVFEGWSTKG